VTIKVLFVPSDGAKPVEVREIEPTLEHMQPLVGGLLQVVNLESPPGSLYCHDEGKLMGLPTNGRATALLWQFNPAFIHQDFVAGDAFICGAPDEEGNDTSAPEEYLGLADA
jgi:hypothetical protein